jgi:hypothetical protein
LRDCASHLPRGFFSQVGCGAHHPRMEWYHCRMNPKKLLAILVLIGVFYFAAFIPANSTGAKDSMMISLFEPDEFAQYPVVTKMLTPSDTFKHSVFHFIIYKHYYYGSPFYFSSALLLLPFNIGDRLDANTQLNMLLLRQFVSVLPMLGTLLLLVYMQTKFDSPAKSIGLFIFLLSVSAVVENNLWWHVDSLAVFFIALTLFFLDKDDLRFSRDFYLAAAATGLAAGTKVLGLFFFLTIPTYLLIGLLRGKLKWKDVFIRGIIFVAIMAAVIVIVNPFMFFREDLNEMIKTLTRQSRSMSEGWTLTYDKGPASWFPIINELYGILPFVILSFIALGLGIWRGKDSTRHILIATWALPLGLYTLFTIAIKPTHFFLPILLPVYSSMIVFLEFPPFVTDKPRTTASWLWGGLVIVLTLLQFGIYISKDVELYQNVLTREENEQSLVFYQIIERDYLPKIKADGELKVFRDVRMYFPEGDQWIVRSYWNSKYSTIEKIKPDILILWAQRIADYTNANALANAIDPAEFQDTYQFYMDAKNDEIRGYRLIYKNEEGLMFVSDAVYEEFFK